MCRAAPFLPPWRPRKAAEAGARESSWMGWSTWWCVGMRWSSCSTPNNCSGSPACMDHGTAAGLGAVAIRIDTHKVEGKQRVDARRTRSARKSKTPVATPTVTTVSGSWRRWAARSKNIDNTRIGLCWLNLGAGGRNTPTVVSFWDSSMVKWLNTSTFTAKGSGFWKSYARWPKRWHHSRTGDRLRGLHSIGQKPEAHALLLATSSGLYNNMHMLDVTMCSFQWLTPHPVWCKIIMSKLCSYEANCVRACPIVYCEKTIRL